MIQIDRIILFGDSFIQGAGCFSRMESDGRMITADVFNESSSDKLIEFQKDESWGKNLKKYFPKCDIINFGLNGCSNYEQFQHFINYFHNVHKPTDLILFGFTSKYRDFSKQFKFMWNTGHPTLLSEENPINNNPLAWDKNQFEISGNEFARSGYSDNISDDERKLSNEFILDYVTNIHDTKQLNYMANTNYIFMQNFSKFHNLNFHCFDLFENYVEGKIGDFLIDTNMYINYNSVYDKSMLRYLIEYECENGRPDEYSVGKSFIVSYFQDNQTYLDSIDDIKKIHHPNQFGYEKWVDYMCTNFLTKKYK